MYIYLFLGLIIRVIVLIDLREKTDLHVKRQYSLFCIRDMNHSYLSSQCRPSVYQGQRDTYISEGICIYMCIHIHIYTCICTPRATGSGTRLQARAHGGRVGGWRARFSRCICIVLNKTLYSKSRFRSQSSPTCRLRLHVHHC